MKANRTLYSAALAVLVGVVLATCGGSDTSEADDTDTSDVELPTIKKGRLIQAGKD